MNPTTPLPRFNAAIRLAIALTLIALTVVVWAEPAHATTRSELEACFRAEINAERSSRGLSTLTSDGTMVGFARPHAQNMADADTGYHPPASKVQQYLPAGWIVYGDNYGGHSNAAQGCNLHDAFMGSQQHRDNILNPAFDTYGVGVAITEGGGMWVYQLFVDTGSGPPATTTTTTTSSTTTTTTTTTTSAPTTTTTAPDTTTTTTATTIRTTTTTTPGQDLARITEDTPIAGSENTTTTSPSSATTVGPSESFDAFAGDPDAYTARAAGQTIVIFAVLTSVVGAGAAAVAAAVRD